MRQETVAYMKCAAIVGVSGKCSKLPFGCDDCPVFGKGCDGTPDTIFDIALAKVTKADKKAEKDCE